MTKDKSKPEEIKDTDLDKAQGGAAGFYTLPEVDDEVMLANKVTTTAGRISGIKRVNPDSSDP